ncbi:hypothetical protein H7H51_04125 [Mycolicibacterium farcinogenes]|nr:hypothetical protein [Mycolicibacterium farcinogenes]
MRQLAESVRAKVRTDVREATRQLRNPLRDSDTARVDTEVTEKAPEPVEVRVRPPISIRSALAAQRERVQVPTWKPGPVTEQRDIQVASPLRDALKPADPDRSDHRIESLASAAGTADPPDPVETIHDVLRSLGALALNPEPQDYPKPLSVLGRRHLRHACHPGAGRRRRSGHPAGTAQRGRGQQLHPGHLRRPRSRIQLVFPDYRQR